jgi:hypothetical protein
VLASQQLIFDLHELSCETSQVKKGFKQTSSTCTFYTLLHVLTHTHTHPHPHTLDSHSHIRTHTHAVRKVTSIYISKSKNRIRQLEHIWWSETVSAVVFHRQFKLVPEVFLLRLVVLKCQQFEGRMNLIGHVQLRLMFKQASSKCRHAQRNSRQVFIVTSSDK